MTTLNPQDVKLVGETPMSQEFLVKSGTTGSIKFDDLVILDGANAGYVKKAPNGASSSDTWVGVCVRASEETASADGAVEVRFSKAGLVVELEVTTAGNLAQSVIGTKVTLDVSGGVQKLDENDTTNGVLTILSYDATAGTAKVLVPCNL